MSNLLSQFLKLKLFQKIIAILITVLVVAGLFLRLFKLNQIPVSYYHDEMDYVLTGETVARWGTDLTGQWSPWQLLPLHTYNYTAELPAVIQAAVQQVFGYGPGSGHAASAIFGLLTVGLAAYLAWKLSGNKKIAFLASLVVLLNPWHIYISRMGYEAIISLAGQAIFVLGLVCLWQQRQSRWRNVLFLLLGGLVFGYFTYHGAKLTLLFLAGVGSLLTIFPWPKKPSKQQLIISLLVLLTAGLLATYSWFLTQRGFYGGRESEFIWTSEFLTSKVDLWHRQSIAWPLASKVVNKYTVLMWEATQRYLSTFDIYRLVVSGYESGFQFSLAVHGFWYLSSLFFLPLGLVTAWKKSVQQSAIKKIIILLFLSPVATAFSETYQSIFRSALTYYLLLIFVGWGMYYLHQKWQRQWGAQVVFLLLILIQVIWFGVQYFGAYPVVSSENHYFDQELLAAYVARQHQPVEIYVENNAYQFARSLVFYNQLAPALTFEQRQQFSEVGRNEYNLAQAKVIGGCPGSKDVEITRIMSAGTFADCGYEQYLATAEADLKTINTLSSPRDSHAYFFLVPDTVCQQQEVGQFIHAPLLQQYNPHQLSLTEFCRTWVKEEKLQL